MAAASLTAAGLGSQILKPEDAQYKERIDSFFDSSAKLHPDLILQPRTAAEVAEAVKALVSGSQQFAVRAGGCGNRAGSNNIDGGVTIDLGLMDDVDYDSKTELASLAPGANWYIYWLTLPNLALAHPPPPFEPPFQRE